MNVSYHDERNSAPATSARHYIWLPTEKLSSYMRRSLLLQRRIDATYKACFSYVAEEGSGILRNSVT